MGARVSSIPYSLLEQKRLEAYLEEKAEQGYVLKKISDVEMRAQFEEKEAGRSVWYCTAYYRKRITKKCAASEEFAAFCRPFEEAGWRYVCGAANLAVFSGEGEERPLWPVHGREESAALAWEEDAALTREESAALAWEEGADRERTERLRTASRLEQNRIGESFLLSLGRVAVFALVVLSAWRATQQPAAEAGALLRLRPAEAVILAAYLFFYAVAGNSDLLARILRRRRAVRCLRAGTDAGQAVEDAVSLRIFLRSGAIASPVILACQLVLLGTLSFWLSLACAVIYPVLLGAFRQVLRREDSRRRQRGILYLQIGGAAALLVLTGALYGTPFASDTFRYRVRGARTEISAVGGTAVQTEAGNALSGRDGYPGPEDLGGKEADFCFAVSQPNLACGREEIFYQAELPDPLSDRGWDDLLYVGTLRAELKNPAFLPLYLRQKELDPASCRLLEEDARAAYYLTKDKKTMFALGGDGIWIVFLDWDDERSFSADGGAVLERLKKLCEAFSF